ncbi:hypothetical protein [Lapidilactobacillus wuchangensis]|uniref:hypothetical protein n=1 Tax=Lapidilactobacillus wuchangensis TaxID=2486001 RepID=UPI000F7B11E5|nr:hypothetical protein [Lapidilactobacillus wuchangensis]
MRKFLRRANLGFVASQRWLIDVIIASLIFLVSLLGVVTIGYGLIITFWWLAGSGRHSWRQLLTWRVAGQSLLIQLGLISGLVLLGLPLLVTGQLLAQSALLSSMLIVSSLFWGSLFVSGALWASWRLGQTNQLQGQDFRIFGQLWCHFWWLLLIGLVLLVSGCFSIWLWPASCVLVLGTLLYLENFGFNYSQQRLLGIKERVG